MLIIDRFEGEKAVIESSEGKYELPKNELPPESKEGDVLKISIDRDKTSSRKQVIKELSEKLFE
mgnify:CR=1 FL=1